MNISIIFMILCCFSSVAHAGEGINARMKAVQQQRAGYQQQMQQRAVQQQQQQVIQQTMAQQQAVLRQATLAHQQAAYQATLQQHQQQVFAQQQHALGQASAHQAAQVQQQLAYQQSVQQAAYNQAMGGAPLRNMKAPQMVAQTTTMEDIWNQLDSSSYVWNQVMDQDAKEVIVVKYMQELRKEGGYIRKGPAHYIQMIDQMAIENPGIMDNPFKNILQIVAIMEYDFDNGMDKEVLAKHVLRGQAYQNNLKRIGR